MRRLAIIDLNTGHQPVSNEDGTVWIVFNGEIYNFRELRKDLIAAGHRFRTQSDTETIVHLYEQEGVAGISKLRGMFAFAIHDRRDGSLLLVRDRFGKKPLYYSEDSRGLYFGSEIKCLRVAGIGGEIDHEAILLYLQFSYIPDPYTAWRSIRKMLPGSWLRFKPGSGITTGTYWQVPRPGTTPPPGMTRAEAVVRVRELFDDSVKSRLISDVPLGAFLSGGVDSGSVVASMALQTGEPVRTFSVGFDEPEYNELAAARLVAEKYRTDHHEILVKPDSVALVEKLAHAFDEPFGDASAIPTYLVSQFAAARVKVVLSGDGGDELFAGYPSVPDTIALKRFDRIPGLLRAILSGLADALPSSAPGRNYLRMIGRRTAFERYIERTYGTWYLRSVLLNRDWLLPAGEDRLRRDLPQCFISGEAEDVVQYFEATASLAGDMLVKVDRMSSANSLEVRCPLLDNQLAEFAFSLPLSWKLEAGKGKKILRDAVGDRLPAELLALPKKGFGVPLPIWFRTSLRSYLEDHLTSRQCRERGVIAPDALAAILNEHQTGRRDHGLWLWRLLMLELWFRRQSPG